MGLDIMKKIIMVILSVLSITLLVGCSKEEVKTAKEYGKKDLSKANDIEEDEYSLYANFGNYSSLYVENDESGNIYSVSLDVSGSDFGQENYYLDGMIEYINSLTDTNNYSIIKNEIDSLIEKGISYVDSGYTDRFSDSNVILETETFVLEQRANVYRTGKYNSDEIIKDYYLDLYLKKY